MTLMALMTLSQSSPISNIPASDPSKKLATSSRAITGPLLRCATAAVVMEFVKLSEHQDKPLIRRLQLCNCQSQSRHWNNQGKILVRSKNICLSLLYQTHVIL